MNNRMVTNLQIKTMCRFLCIILLITFSLFSCINKENKEEQLKLASFNSPVTIKALPPIITLLDTCPKPMVMVIPKNGIRNYTLAPSDGGAKVKLPAPAVQRELEGEAGGYTFMEYFGTEQGLALSTICCGFKDKTGNLWFGTSGGGVSRYDGKSFTNFTTAQGLAFNIVKCIIEDKNGNIWFGTYGGGVSKYDGKSFVNYGTKQGLVNNRVMSITEDKNGNLWFSTPLGISIYNPDAEKGKNLKSFTNFTRAEGLISSNVRVSFGDSKGNIWFGTDKGISKCFPNPRLTNLYGNPAGDLFTNYTTNEGLPNNIITSIIEDKNGNMWFGTAGGGACKFNPNIKVGSSEKQFTVVNQTQGLSFDNVTCIIEDKNGFIWFGTEIGVSRFNPCLKSEVGSASFTNFRTAQGLSNNTVSCITEDKSGSLWIGNAFGLNKYNGKSITSFTLDQGLVYSKVWSTAEDNEKNLWFATSNGISKYDRKKFTNYHIEPITTFARCIIKDKMGNIWFGTGFGVTKYDGKSFTNYTTSQGLAHNTILCMAEDKAGNIWFGTYGGGVSKYDGNRVEALNKGGEISAESQKDLKKINGKFVESFTNYTVSQGLSDNTIKCIREDKNGNIWFGTNGNGVSKYSCPDKTGNTSFTNYSKAQGLPYNTVLSIMEDKSGTLWFGTAGGGVCSYSPSIKVSTGTNPFTEYNSSDGMANDIVYAIAEDTINNINWFGTNQGLSGLKMNSLSKGEIVFENFNNSTGYPIKDLNTGGLFIDKKGIMWAGTNDKLVRFDYKGIHKSTEPPAVFIQAVRIQGEKIIWYNLKSKNSSSNEINNADSMAAINEEVIAFNHPLKESKRSEMRKKFIDVKFDSITRFYPLPVNLVLPFKNNSITFDFSAIETARPLMVRYKYILEGYDNEWSIITDKTTAVFGNINEGSYTFKLKACSPDGIWSEPVLYAFKVLPPWYRTWWMYICYLLIVLSGMGLFFRWRTAALRKEKELLEQTVKERTAEVVEKKELIEEKQKEIVDSINYAKRIQQTLLANDDALQQNLKDYFVLFQPKDIVSGDFYWAASPSQPPQRGGDPTHMAMDTAVENPPPSGELEGAFYLAICDSTGHGVPGAFMSLLNISFLNEAITEKHIKQPNEILNHVRQRLIESVSQDGGQDGMDGILLCIENEKITYSAANNAPVIVRDNSILSLPADKMPIGKGEKGISFTHFTIDTKPGDILYFYTDGYADQFGGPKGKKFKYKQLDELLISIHKKPMEEQKQILTETIEKWKGNLEQVDDILIVGMRIGYE